MNFQIVVALAYLLDIRMSSYAPVHLHMPRHKSLLDKILIGVCLYTLINQCSLQPKS